MYSEVGLLDRRKKTQTIPCLFFMVNEATLCRVKTTWS